MFSVCKRNYITELTLDTVLPLKVLWSRGRSLQRSANKPGFTGMSIWYLELEADLSFATKMVEFPPLFVFWARTFLQGLGGLRKLCFPLKRGPVCLQGIGASAPLLSLQAEPAELQTTWLYILGCAIFCSRLMSPWLTITAHSVLLFSPEPLNGSLAFNETCIVCSKVCFNPFLSGFLDDSLSVLSWCVSWLFCSLFQVWNPFSWEWLWFWSLQKMLSSGIESWGLVWTGALLMDTSYEWSTLMLLYCNPPLAVPLFLGCHCLNGSLRTWS